MKKFYFCLFSIALLAVWSFSTFRTSAQTENPATDTTAVSPNLVISGLYGGGGNSNAVYTNDYVEIFNRGTSAVSLNGWSTQYASANGTEFLVTPLSNVSLQPGQHYLIQYASNGTVGAALPTPNVIAPAITNNAGNTFIPNLSGTTGKLALVNSTTRLPASSCPSDATIVDFVGYGANASCFEGTKTADLSNSTGAARKGNGCVDTDNNSADFTIGTPSPRNTASAISSCDLNSILQAGIAANPTTTAPGGNVLFTVSVVPATTPPSTGITVVGNLSNIGGSAAQSFFDDGTNGDVTAGDNIFSYSAAIPANAVGGTYAVTATASDAQSRSVNLNINITINAPLADENPLLLGNPSNATPDVANENNYLLVRPQYTISYNRSKATPNWVAWRLDSTWLGSTSRQDNYRADTDLPAGWYRVLETDYSGSGYDRGHMCPSGDRTRSVADNSATFLMTNFVPQLPANNQGPWEEFESYCRTVAGQGNEIYIITGPSGNIGTVAGGKIVVPQVTWKVVLIMPNGNNDLSRVTRAVRAFGIIVPNQPPLDINAPWRNFRTTVDAVENLTGYDFYSNVPKITQSLIERKRDIQ